MIPTADRTGQVWMLDEKVDSWIAIVISSSHPYDTSRGLVVTHECVCRYGDGSVVSRPWNEMTLAWEKIPNFVRVL